MAVVPRGCRMKAGNGIPHEFKCRAGSLPLSAEKLLVLGSVVEPQVVGTPVDVKPVVAWFGRTRKRMRAWSTRGVSCK